MYRYGASLMAQMINNLSAMRETQVLSLGWEDLLEEEMVTHSSILAWRIPRIQDLYRYLQDYRKYSYTGGRDVWGLRKQEKKDLTRN